MAINIGYDTTTSQFDVMIPGEELYIITDVIVSQEPDLGQIYGGLLADYESSVGYSYTEDII